MLENLLYVFAHVVNLFFTVIDIAMLVRAVTSWIPTAERAWVDFVYAITEPFVAPIRNLLERFSLFQNSPIDFSFMIAYVLIIILQEIFSAFTAAVL